ncbi:MAG: hypothetical protein U1D97_03400, partial [Desulfuromonadales bacterium]|nr:hypothetical protein [Desulfuromonadales bacterium]
MVRAYKGRLWIEVFLIRGMNADVEAVKKMAGLAATLNPEAIHINTAVRPPAEAFACAVPRTEMESLALRFSPVATVIAEYSPEASAAIAINEDTILTLLK